MSLAHPEITWDTPENQLVAGLKAAAAVEAYGTTKNNQSHHPKQRVRAYRLHPLIYPIQKSGDEK